MPSPTDDETPFPTLTHAATFGAYGRSSQHLSPDDANVSPPRRARDFDGHVANHHLHHQYARARHGDRSRSRRRKRAWKKLMWVKQSYPDNFTDQATFLENLQLNPRLKPYDFWPLVADSTVILQHVCSVLIFVVCFVWIFKDRVSPVSVVSWSTAGTFLGWLLWERWVSEEEDQEEEAAALTTSTTTTSPALNRTGSTRRRNRAGSIRRPPHPLRAEAIPSSTPTSAASSTTNLKAAGKRTQSSASLEIPAASYSRSSSAERLANGPTPKGSNEALARDRAVHGKHIAVPFEESRANLRLGTIKSALLIYSTLLGLSPILKSLTRSTSKDSIWAMSFWLLAINIFFFDYSGGVGAKFPASLSTNAALMASTVLASRLPNTKQVFSLTLFSIEVFGLFPVFRRHVRHRSWQYHVVLTVLLVIGAGLGVGMVLAESNGHGDPRGDGSWPWKSGIVGMVVAVCVAVLATGGCSWWLIGLQKYKNEIRGPWDPARPIIMSRTRWDDG